MNPPTGAPLPPPQPEAKKGMSTGAKVGIGCGIVALIAIILIGLLVKTCVGVAKDFSEQAKKNPDKAAAELIVKLNPEIEKVGEDEAKGEITIRTKKTGETVTLKYKDLAEGRLTVTNDKGETASFGATDLSEVPSWVPRPASLTEAQGGMQVTGQKEGTGSYVGKSEQSLQELADFFTAEAEKLGLKTENTMSLGSDGAKMLIFRNDARTMQITLNRKAGETHSDVLVVYTEKK